MVREKRRVGQLSLREAGAEAGVAFNTLARVEAGHIPDLQTFRRIVDWLGLSASEFFGEAQNRQVSTPDVIASHLLADPSLSPGSAERIAGLVRDLYAALARPAMTTAIHLRAAKTFKPHAANMLADILTELDESLAAEVD
ncbi:MAG: helix-turn-helix transcriptional regulator [Chloroflexi bacterium]|nr:helix-turn-helix transcriptional regulator [Chloroflexota bacterium]